MRKEGIPMKKILAFALAAALLTGCGNSTVAEVTTQPATEAPAVTEVPAGISVPEDTIPYESRFSSETVIVLSDEGITVNGDGETDTVFTSRDIIYYENRETYDSGNPYGEGTAADRHTAEEADAHLVVNITAPGAYRLSGKLSAGQIRIDLGDDAYEDPEAVVELILENADITCSVAPAILFLNTYECDGNWSEDDAKPDVDTSAAGANLILDGSNKVHGAYVAKIFKDKDGEKKLWKQDGAIYSYMSMNVFGPGSLELTADNEGLDTELHLTINGGDITILSHNDGINTNEDNVSVTTINSGSLTIYAGLGAEGDGIDSNGYLLINGGNVLSCAKPISDAGLDSDLGSYVHGGTVIALGSTMDWAESNSKQVTMNLQFASQQTANSIIRITDTSGNEVFSCAMDTYDRTFSGLVLSAPNLKQGETYQIWVNDVQQQYTGTDVGFGFGRPGMGGMPGGMTPPESFGGQMPEDFKGQMPEGGFGGRGERPEGFENKRPEDFTGEMPSMPEGMQPGQRPEGNFGGRDFGNESTGEPSTEFYMNDKVNAFSGVTAIQ